MDFKEQGQDIWRELHKLNSTVRMVRSDMALGMDVTCARSVHLLFFQQVRDSFLESLIMGVGRLVDDTKGVLSMGKWLDKAFAKAPQSVDRKKLQVAKDEYEKLVSSKQCKVVQQLRHNFYAHSKAGWNVEDAMGKITWGELFTLVEELQRIFNLAAESGLCDGWSFGKQTIFVTGEGGKDIEDDMESMLKALEESCHTGKMHERNLKRTSQSDD